MLGNNGTLRCLAPTLRMAADSLLTIWMYVYKSVDSAEGTVSINAVINLAEQSFATTISYLAIFLMVSTMMSWLRVRMGIMSSTDFSA